MKVLIACYSDSGNTLKVAEMLQENLKADLTKIEALKNKLYLLKIWDSLRNNQVPIKPCITNLRDYDALLICCPAWAGTTPPAINKYLFEVKNIKDKFFGVLVTSKSNRAGKASRKIREFLSAEGMIFMGQIKVLNKYIKNNSYPEILELFTLKFRDPEGY